MSSINCSIKYTEKWWACLLFYRMLSVSKYGVFDIFSNSKSMQAAKNLTMRKGIHGNGYAMND